MPRQGAGQTDTPRPPDSQIAKLVNDFQQAPHDLFCEPDLHAHFFRLGREAYPTPYLTTDGIRVTAFRYQYESIWRYASDDRFAHRQRKSGATATFDFVLLGQSFIERSDYLTVTDKDEHRRADLRRLAEDQNITISPPVHFAIEIKMAAFRNALEVDEGDINRLEDRMLDACRKVAAERVSQAYVLGLSHGPSPDLPRAQAMVSTCMQLRKARHPDGQISVLVATPTQTVLGGDWAEDVEFPKVAVRSGWPVAE